jgi:hypothetical protein
MHPIGTHILRDGVTTADYAANSKVPLRFLRKFVKSLAKIGANCFPDVLAVIQDIEGDTGLQPVACMVDEGIEYCVAFSIDKAVDLGNASHYNVGDVLQGFSVWTEEVPGLAANWFFLMPNVCGMNNGIPFNGVAIKLYHGTSICWDGRVIRHCTSMTFPDGINTEFGGGAQPTLNHVYGTFSALKRGLLTQDDAWWQQLRLLGALSHLHAMMLLLLLLVWMLMVLELGRVMMMTTKTINSLGGIKCFHRTIPKLRTRTLMATLHPKMDLRLTGCISMLRKTIGTCHNLTMQLLLKTTHPFSFKILIVEMMNMAAWTLMMVMAIDMSTLVMTLWTWGWLVTMEDSVG